jgi:hypothetical protein
MQTIIVQINMQTLETRVETDGYGPDSGEQCMKDAQPFIDALGEPDGPPEMKAQTVIASTQAQVAI